MRRRPDISRGKVDEDSPLYSLDEGARATVGALYSKLSDPPAAPIRHSDTRNRGFTPSAEYGSLQARTEDRRIERVIENIAGKSPPWFAKFLRAFSPFLTVTFTLMNIVGPSVIAFYGFLFKIYTMLPKNFIGIIYGLIMCFFGGFFHVTIAAIEAFNMTGGEKVFLCLHDLKIDFENFARANALDDKKDDDNDGIPDVKQISGEKLVTRKTALALRVINPDRATNAITGVWQGYMGVLVVLKFRYAKVIALAVSIGNNLRPLAAKVFGPALAFLMPEEYHQWIAPLINFFCKFVAMTMAWWIQRFISTVQSAIKGGLLFGRSLMCLISEWTPLQLNPDTSWLDEVMGWSLAAFGAYFQISMNWNLPWTVDLLLWPAYVLEKFLQWSVTWMDVQPTAV